MQVNPHAWIPTIPLLLLVATLPGQPDSNPLKRLWSKLQNLEGDMWFNLGVERGLPDPVRVFARGSVGHRALVGTLGAFALLSLVNFFAL